MTLDIMSKGDIAIDFDVLEHDVLTRAGPELRKERERCHPKRCDYCKIAGDSNRTRAGVSMELNVPGIGVTPSTEAAVTVTT
jgi:hypothetical protein